MARLAYIYTEEYTEDGIQQVDGAQCSRHNTVKVTACNSAQRVQHRARLAQQQLRLTSRAWPSTLELPSLRRAARQSLMAIMVLSGAATSCGASHSRLLQAAGEQVETRAVVAGQ